MAEVMREVYRPVLQGGTNGQIWDIYTTSNTWFATVKLAGDYSLGDPTRFYRLECPVKYGDHSSVDMTWEDLDRILIEVADSLENR